MIGICPHCKIKLKEKPFSNRLTNEILVVMSYRQKIESKSNLKDLKDLGYCEVCNATLDDLKEQNIMV